MNYRARWYASRGLEYEPPSLARCPPFRCVGIDTEHIYRRLTGGELGPRQQRLREPGEDLDEAA